MFTLYLFKRLGNQQKLSFDINTLDSYYLGSSPVPALNNDLLSSLNLPPLDMSKLPALDPDLFKGAPGRYLCYT